MKKNKKQNIIPVLLGADLGAYSMAVSFALAGVKPSVVLGRDKLALSSTSSLVRAYVIRGLDDCDTAVPELIRLSSDAENSRLILVPCADWYMEMLQYARDALTGHYFFMIPPFEVWRAVSDKASFTVLLDKFGINHPRTEIFDRDLSKLMERGSALSPPFVVKPSDSSEYYRHKFKGMKKVYFAHSLDEAGRIMEMIYSSGYGGRMLLQEYVNSNGRASVLTVFIGGDGRAKRAVVGDILLEETAPGARGNYSAIITRPLDAISYKLIDMLERIGYRGFANLDILHDANTSYCLELNPRQGRSFDYTRGAGFGAAEMLVCEMLGKPIEENFSYPEYLWRAVKKRTALSRSENPKLKKKAQELIRSGKCYTPYALAGDGGILRRLYVGVHLMRCDRSMTLSAKRKEMI